MPTGYTAGVDNGTITEFSDFVWCCARGMGALILLRDEPLNAPIPEAFEESPFYATRLAETRAEMDAFAAMSIEQRQALMAKEEREAVQQYQERVKEKEPRRERYTSMLAQAKKWNPPTSDHKGLKDFMIQQLQESMKYDCSEPTPPQPVPFFVWHAEKLASLACTLEHCQQALTDEKDRTAARNAWLKALRESVPQIQKPNS